jgi:hypothetical protein
MKTGTMSRVGNLQPTENCKPATVGLINIRHIAGLRSLACGDFDRQREPKCHAWPRVRDYLDFRETHNLVGRAIIHKELVLTNSPTTQFILKKSLIPAPSLLCLTVFAFRPPFLILLLISELSANRSALFANCRHRQYVAVNRDRHSGILPDSSFALRASTK